MAAMLSQIVNSAKEDFRVILGMTEYHIARVAKYASNLSSRMIVVNMPVFLSWRIRVADSALVILSRQNSIVFFDSDSVVPHQVMPSIEGSYFVWVSLLPSSAALYSCISCVGVFFSCFSLHFFPTFSVALPVFAINLISVFFQITLAGFSLSCLSFFGSHVNIISQGGALRLLSFLSSH